jgi:hypothetical protein
MAERGARLARRACGRLIPSGGGSEEFATVFGIPTWNPEHRNPTWNRAHRNPTWNLARGTRNRTQHNEFRV